MARNDDGEFELILGNRQLVSVFLIVVILLGAFFSMGYLVGRSASSAVSADAGAHTDSPSKPIVVDSGRAAAPAASETPTPAAPSKPSPTSPVTTAPPVKPAVVERPKVEEPKPEPRKEVAKREEPPARNEAPGRVSADEPSAGQTFLQVVATSRGDAQIVAESLAKKGFRAHIAAGPSATIFRVLVGPLPNAAEVAETRVRLEASGFKPIMRRY